MTLSNETLSNETAPSPRIYTWTAVTLSAISIAALLVLFVQVQTLNKKWSTLEANRERIEVQTGEWQDRLDRLDEEVRSREGRLLELRAGISGLEAEATRLDRIRRDIAELEDLRRETEAFIEENEGLEGQIERAEATLSQLSGTIAASENALDNLNSEMTSLGRAVDDLTAQREELRTQRDTLSREVTDLEALRGDVRNLASRRDELSSEVADKGSTNQQLDLDRQRLEQQVNAATASLASLRNGIKEAQDQKQDFETELAGLAGEISESKTALETIESTRRSQTTRVNELESQTRSLEAQATDAAAQAASAQSDLTQIQTRLETARAELATTEARIAERAVLVEKVDALEVTVQELEGTVTAKTAERNDLVNAVASLQSVREQTQDELENLTSQLSAARGRFGQVQEALAREDAKEAALLAAVELLGSEEEALSGRVSALRSNRDVLERELETTRADLAEARASLGAASERVRTLETEMDNLALAFGELHATRERLRLDRQSAADELSRLQAEIASLTRTMTDLLAQIGAARGVLDQVPQMQTVNEPAPQVSGSIVPDTKASDN